MKLSNQAVGALMMALQKSLMEQSDIVPTLLEMDFVTTSDGELQVTNPPIVSLPAEMSPEEDNEILVP
jgi:hypothetical protein